MPFPRVLVFVLAAALTATGCSSSSTESTEAGGFLLSARTEDAGVADRCIELADDVLGAAQQQISILGQRTFADWVTTGVFYVEDEAPDVAAALEGSSTGYQDAGCPEGYLAATVLAHGDRFDLKSPAAAIWWAGMIASTGPLLGEGAAGEDQEQAWLELAAADERDLSDRTVIPSLAEIEAIGSCEELGVAAADLLQQQMYLISGVEFRQPVSDALGPLAGPRAAIADLVELTECDQVRREVLLRQAHTIEVGGPHAVLAYATELDAAWQLWSEEALDPALDIQVNVIDQDRGEVGVLLRNAGNVPVRVVSLDLDGVAVDDLRLDLVPEQEEVVPVTLGAPPGAEVELTVELQTPPGISETQSGPVPVG